MLSYNIKLIITVICAILLLLFLLTPHHQQEQEGNNNHNNQSKNLGLLSYPSVIFQYQIAATAKPPDSS